MFCSHKQLKQQHKDSHIKEKWIEEKAEKRDPNINIVKDWVTQKIGNYELDGYPTY